MRTKKPTPPSTRLSEADVVMHKVCEWLLSKCIRCGAYPNRVSYKLIVEQFVQFVNVDTAFFNADVSDLDEHLYQFFRHYMPVTEFTYKHLVTLVEDAFGLTFQSDPSLRAMTELGLRCTDRLTYATRPSEYTQNTMFWGKHLWSHEELLFIGTILQSLKGVYPVWVNRTLGVLLRCMKYIGLTSICALRDFDIETLQTRVSGFWLMFCLGSQSYADTLSRLRRILGYVGDNCSIQPSGVDRSIYMSLPAFFRYAESSFFRKLQTLDAVSRGRLVCCVTEVITLRLAAGQAKQLDRTVASVCKLATNIVHLLSLLGLVEHRDISHYLAPTLTLSELSSVCSRVIARHNKVGSSSVSRGISIYKSTSKDIVNFMNSLIKCGIFCRVPIESRIRLGVCNFEACALSSQHPDIFSHHKERPPSNVPEVDLTDDIIEAIYACAKTARERFVLRFSQWSGVRRGVFNRMLVTDAWDVMHMRPLPNIIVREKNGSIRFISLLHDTPIVKETRDLLGEYIEHEHPGIHSHVYMFPNLKDPKRMCLSVARNVLALNARRAGLEKCRLHHHQFRRYIVNKYMSRKGSTLDAVSKFLGHRSISTTMKHYWTNNVLMDMDTEINDNTMIQNTMLKREVEVLRNKLEKCKQHDPHSDLIDDHS